MSSTARLTSQLKAVQGWAEVSFVGASLQIPLSSNLESVRCSVVVNKQGVAVTRNSSACAFSESVLWNQEVTFPCCLDWDIEFSIRAVSNRNKEVVAVSDVMLVQSAGRLTLPLRIGAKRVGELEVSLVFHPNYRSFKYLAIGCYLSEQLSYSLTNSLLNDLRKTSNTTEGQMHATATEDDVMSIVATIDNFTTFLTDEETYHKELCAALNIPFDRTVRGDPEKQLSTGRFESLLRQRHSTPQQVPIHRVAKGAKNFLAKLLDGLPQVPCDCVICCAVSRLLCSKLCSTFDSQPPPVSMDIVEKIINIYTQALFVPDIRRAGSTPASHAKATEMALTWSQFAQLCIVCALWYLQQAVSAHELLAQCTSLTLEELAALRFGFAQYDAELSSVISVSDLHSLLQVSALLPWLIFLQRWSRDLAYRL
jgi:hypothetical protein